MIPKLFPALVLLFLFALNLLAAPGDLDPTFGSGGKSLIPVSKISYDQGRAAALQPDGKIVVVGDSISDYEYSAETTNLVATRLNADGSRDTSFGINGLAVMRLRISVTGAAILIQPDGKIVIGGFGLVASPSAVRTFVLVRLLSDGAIDSTFGTGGVVRDLITTNLSAMLAGLALQPDGKVVACGWTGTSTNPAALVVARYNSNGSLDTSFDTDGKLFVNVNPQGNRGNAVLIQPDGKIVVGGSLRETTGTITDFLLVRLNSDGSFDDSFDSDGKVATKITTSTSSVTALVLQGDGKIVAVGSSNIGANRNVALVRYTSGGTPDTTFDSDGVVVTDVTDEIPTSAGLQSDGKILVGGLATISAGMPFHFLASRYNSDGSPDNSFDLDGRVVTALTTVTDRVNSLLLQSDDRIVVAGSSTDIPDADISLARYNSDGSQDSTFDGDGLLTVELENGGDRIYDTVIQSDGKIVAVGYAFAGLVIQPAIARYNADGSQDLSFGVGGTFLPPIPPEFESSYADKVAIQSDGKIVFAVRSLLGRPFTAVRLNPNGSLDTSFGTGGVVQITIGTTVDVPAGLVVQPDDKILLAGFAQNVGMPYSPALIRLNPNGELDSSFGSGGKVVTTDPAISGQVFAVELQTDGKILIAGQGLSGSSFFTSRYNANGSIDTTFGGTGAVYTSVSGFDAATMLAVQSDGKIVAGGAVDVTGVAVRYTSAGVLDTTFDGDGKLIVNGESGRTYWLSDLKIQTNGKLVFSGAERDPGNQFGTSPRRAALIRFNSDGTPDVAFGPNGRVISTIGTYNSEFFSLNILSNGKIIGGGSSSNGSNDDFTLVRYVGDSAVGPRAPFDFDGDDKTDIGIFRPSGGEWWINRSGNGQTFALQFGASTDVIAPADYTGDGKADIAFFRPSSGEWYILRSEDFSFFALPFGANGDVPVPADYDADGKADFAVFRPSTSAWFISQSGGGGTRIFQFGIAGDKPIVADYDADGKADVGVFRQAAGGAEWWIDRSTAGSLAIQFGANTDKAVHGDYTGDGKADIAIWRPASGEWFIVRSEDFSFYGFPFGANGDVVAPGDYDGDGKYDPTVFRPSSATWFIARTTSGTQIVQFGATGDRPLPNAFVP